MRVNESSSLAKKEIEKVRGIFWDQSRRLYDKLIMGGKARVGIRLRMFHAQEWLHVFIIAIPSDRGALSFPIPFLLTTNKFQNKICQLVSVVLFFWDHTDWI